MVVVAVAAAAAAEEEGCKFDNGHDHREGGALDGDKSLVHVDTHGISQVEESSCFVWAGIGV